MLTAAWLFARHGRSHRARVIVEALVEDDPTDGVAAAALARRPCQGDLFATNGLTREGIAIKLISSQRAGGWWLMETNPAPTRLAIQILKGL